MSLMDNLMAPLTFYKRLDSLLHSYLRSGNISKLETEPLKNKLKISEAFPLT